MRMPSNRLLRKGLRALCANNTNVPSAHNTLNALRSAIGLILVAGAVTLALACGGGPGDGPRDPLSVTFNVGTEPETLDPATSTGIPDAQIIAQCLETLIRLDADLEVEPALAERWEISDDGLTYTFHLREARWSNGDPVLASHFADQWVRVLDPATASEYAILLYYVRGAAEFNRGDSRDRASVAVSALDERTLQVELNNPTPYFLSMLSHKVFAPFHPDTVTAGPRAWRTRPETYLSCGPFALSEWRTHNRIVLTRNPEYWDADKVRLERVVMTMMEMESSALAAFESGQIDAMERPPMSAVDRLKAEGRLRTTTYIGTYFVNFNCLRPPFDDFRVRRALSLAIDRNAIVTHITRTDERPAFALVPDNIRDAVGGAMFREVGGDLFQEDVEEARRLLAEAGFPGGQGFPAITFLYNTRESHKIIAAELQQQWARNLGITVGLSNNEWKVYLQMLHSSDYDLARGGWIGDFPDPMTFLETYVTESGNNNPKWSNERYDALIDESRREGDNVRRLALLHEAEQIMMDEMPLAPLYFYSYPYLQKPGLQGVVRNGLGYVSFKEAYWELGDEE